MKLSEEETNERITHTEDERSGFVTMARKAERMWALKPFKRSQKQAVEQGQEQVVTPDPYNVINLASRLVSDKPLVEVPAFENTDDSTNFKDIRQKWLRGSWQEISKHSGENIIGNARWQLFTLGRAAFQVTWIKPRLPEHLRKTQFPIHVRNLSPYNVGVERGPFFVEHAYHKYETTLSRVVQEYPKAKRKKAVSERIGNTPDSEDWRNETVEFTDFWNRDNEGQLWNSKLIDGKFIQQPEKSDYQDIPIIEAYGDTSMSSDPALKTLSILFPIDGLWQYKCRAMSQMATGLLWYFWPFIYLTNEQGIAVPDLEIKPGSTEQWPAGTELNVVQIQPNMQLSQTMLNTIEGGMQQATFPGVMYGDAPGDLQAGYGVNLLAQAAEGRVDQVRTNLEYAIMHINEIMLGMVETFATEKEGVTIYGHNAANNKLFSETLLPSHMEDGFYKNRVTLKPQMPEDDMSRLTLGKSLVDSGLISARTYRDRWLNIELPDDEENRIFLEQAMKSPELMPKTTLAVLSAYSPDKWREYIRGTPLEQLVDQLEQPEMPPEMSPTPSSLPPGMPGVPPPGIPVGPPPGGMGGGMPPDMMGGMPPGMMGGVPGGMGGAPPIQPEAQMVGPMGGGIPPQLQGQLTEDMLGVQGMPPELFAQLMQRPLSPADEEKALMGAPSRSY